MSSAQLMTPHQVCESLLIEGKRYNIERGILASENAVADRMLARGAELKEVYEELHSKLHAHPFALHDFLKLILSTTAFWNLDAINQSRVERSELGKVNQLIAKKATELADLLGRRSHLNNTSGFWSETHFQIGDVILAASRGNHLFEVYLKERLGALMGQFDLRYWPTLSEIIKELAMDAEHAEITATDPLTAASTEASRPSLADFFKAIFAAMEENSTACGGRLPTKFRLSNKSVASIVNCALDLEPNHMVDDTYVKGLRKRERDIAKLKQKA